MAVNLNIPNKADIFPVPGVEIGIASAGIRKAGHRDITVFQLAPGSSVAGVFTKNRYRAAPVQVCEQHIRTEKDIRALVINTGNANAGTGAPGLEDTERTCTELARLMGLRPTQVLPFSTGVILEPLPMTKLLAALPAAVQDLQAGNWFDAAHSIMTTDTQPKIYSSRFELGERQCTITGISKGAGMIRPNMATMLGFLCTDIGINPKLLKEMTRTIADHSFNRISVDGDTSTNDSFVIVATGQSGLHVDSVASPYYARVLAALKAAALDLAQKIVRDGEGATKFITIQVESAACEQEALKVAYAIAHSPLIKTAFYASDPNLGRILCAIGYAGIDDLEVEKIKLWLGDVLVASEGGRHPGYVEAEGKRVMQESEITIRVALNRGEHSERVYTCDMSHDYVSINADYRS